MMLSRALTGFAIVGLFVCPQVTAPLVLVEAQLVVHPYHLSEVPHQGNLEKNNKSSNRRGNGRGHGNGFAFGHNQNE
uniref:Secreted protein n=1 Tax=Acrobeloides nanus TaxID=290746 RepID=A0A914E8S5_9BILA